MSEELNITEDKLEKDIENGTSEIDNNEEAIIPVENPKPVVEAVLFAMGNSVDIKKLASVLGMSVSETKEIIKEMQDEYNSDENRGVTIVELEGAVQMCSKTEMYDHLLKIATVPKHYALTETVLETLSIVAYKQPVTRIEIEKIRGVNCDHAVNKLLEYGLITELGRLDAPGRPLLFGTTEQFLRAFGVKSIEELPTVTADRLDQFKKEAAEEIQMSLPI
ncbi:MAG: SMC-Scp complex subunit ScpB [Lachnospiraceae bacterium]|nr:SMC-Scp complex subunit ScpB [Lachnospiraceae bacterium]